LRGTEKDLFPGHHQVSREEFLGYLQNYAKEMDLPVQTDTDVRAVEKLGNTLFRVQTSRGDLFARLLVNATGYYSNPFVPIIPGRRESGIPQLHAADYRDPQSLSSILGSPQGEALKGTKSRGLILIVGKRLSAGQIMVELVEAGFNVALSHRAPIQYGAEPWAWWFLFRIFPWLEWLKLKSKGAGAPSNDVRMAGGAARKLIESGSVNTFPPIKAFEADAVIFENGRRLQPDLVLYATGFRPALGHLAPLNLSICPETGRPRLQDLESVLVSGLYFVGLDHARNFQSRFLRGIRKDAAFLADRLELSTTTNHKFSPA
jgi:putative flavoprotein involved in K+ transport